MRWIKQVAAQIQRHSLERCSSNRRPRFIRRTRRLNFEQFEDRRMLATAVSDSFQVTAGQTLTVNGDGAWANDTYDRSWSYTYWGCVDSQYHPGYFDEDGQWHDGYYECLQEDWITRTDHAGGSNGSPAHGSLSVIDSGDYYYDDDGNVAGSYGLAFTYTPD